MDEENGFSLYDPFAPGCDLWDPYCRPDVGGEVIQVVTPPIVIVVNGNAAELGSVQTAVSNLTGLTASIVSILGLLLQAITAIAGLLKLLWGTIVKPAVDALKAALAKMQRILDKILKPIRDALKAQRDALMDIYKRFVRPLIVFLETIRRFIALLKLFHIHLLDKLDAQLAALERRIMTPFLQALGRVNTIGNWISFILNTRLLIFRNLFMRTLDANKGGSFNMLAGAPAYGFAMLPEAQPPAAGTPTHTNTFDTGQAAVNAAIPSLLTKYSGTPIQDLVKCWEEPLPNVALKGAFGELFTCLYKSIPTTIELPHA